MGSAYDVIVVGRPVRRVVRWLCCSLGSGHRVMMVDRRGSPATRCPRIYPVGGRAAGGPVGSGRGRGHRLSAAARGACWTSARSPSSAPGGRGRRYGRRLCAAPHGARPAAGRRRRGAGAEFRDAVLGGGAARDATGGSSGSAGGPGRRRGDGIGARWSSAPTACGRPGRRGWWTQPVPHVDRVTCRASTRATGAGCPRSSGAYPRDRCLRVSFPDPRRRPPCRSPASTRCSTPGAPIPKRPTSARLRMPTRRSPRAGRRRREERLVGAGRPANSAAVGAGMGAGRRRRL